MKSSQLRKLLFSILILIEVISFVAAVAGNRPHGIAADEAFSRWFHNPTPASDQAFQKEMDKLEEGPRKIRRYGFLIFCANSILLFVAYRKFRSGWSG
jgi:hypothetical protein